MLLFLPLILIISQKIKGVMKPRISISIFWQDYRNSDAFFSRQSCIGIVTGLVVACFVGRVVVCSVSKVAVHVVDMVAVLCFAAVGLVNPIVACSVGIFVVLDSAAVGRVIVLDSAVDSAAAFFAPY